LDAIIPLRGSLLPANLHTKKVPQLFVLGPSSRWEDYEHFPWTIGITPSYRREGRVYAQ
jgi:branched-chain amino acid transport system substrate-binding protein